MADVNERSDFSQNGNAVIGSAAIRPVFLGNLKPEYSTAKVEELFTAPIHPPNSTATFKSIAVDRIDIKRGFCFVFLKDAASQEEKDQIEAFVAAIQGMELEGVSSAIRAEFARGDGRVKRKEDDRRRNIEPSETLFVVNFHEETTKREDLQMLFEPYGELLRIDMKRNYAFVQFRTIEEATRALNATNNGKLDQSVLSVEYVARQRADQDRRRRPEPRGGGGGERRGGGGGGGYDRSSRGGGPSNRGPPAPLSRGDGSDRSYNRASGGRYDTGGLPPPRDDYRPRGRDRSPIGYRDDNRPRDSGFRGDRGVSPAGGYDRGGAGRGGRSRSRSRSPPRGGGGGGGGGGGYRSRSPPRYDRRYDDVRDRRAPPPQGAMSPDDYRDRRSPDRGFYRGRDDRGYRG